MDIDKKFLDSTSPLLDKFRELAPGSYKHCQNVSNICETIAIELGMNIDLLKCAALFHDIGKMNNPDYFTENQSDGINPHSTLEPFVSHQIITRHVGDGVLYLVQEQFPIEVIQIVSQHHGNTILKSIHNKVKNDPEDKYRYKSCPPTTPEAAILMIVDSVEATAKSLYNNDENDFAYKAINGTIDRLIDDDQIDTMKIGTLKIVKKVLMKELESIYHKRVSYENEDEITIAETKEKKPYDDDGE